MKKIFVITLLLAWISIGNAVEVPEEMELRIKNPPSISGGDKQTAFTCGTKSTIIEGEDFISLISFSEPDEAGRVKYQFQSYSKKHQL